MDEFGSHVVTIQFGQEEMSLENLRKITNIIANRLVQCVALEPALYSRVKVILGDTYPPFISVVFTPQGN
jgi:hypothetical protein